MITKSLTNNNTISQLYIFESADEAEIFYTKYSTVWTLSKPFPTLSGWTITRTIKH